MFARKSHGVLTRTERLGIHSAGLIALITMVSLTWVLFVVPVQRQMSEKEVSAASMRNLTDSYPMLQRTKTQLLSELQVENARLRALSGMIPRGDGIDEQLIAMHEAADRSQVAIASIRPQAAQERRICTVQEFVVTATCHHAALCQFLQFLAQQERPIYIAEMHVQPTGVRHPDVDSQQLAVTLNIQFPVTLNASWQQQVDQLLQVDSK